jgi:glycosyltransferase involved in cell wall biosynthesis
MERLRPRFYHHFLFIGPGTAKKLSLEKRGGTIIPNGISPDLLNISPGSEGKDVLFLGRIDMYGKGLDLLLRAYQEFHRSFPDLGLVIAGDGRDREELVVAIGRMPEAVRERIRLAGWISGEQKAHELRAALFVVFPSRHEVQPIAVLEAMAAGKAVVVSDIPEFSFATRSGAGLSFKTGDALSLALSMKELMTRAERQEMGVKGRETVKGLTWDGVALQFERFLKDVAERAG